MSSGLPAIPLSDQNGQKDQKEQKNVKQSESKLQVPTNDPVHAPLLAVVNEADWAAVADTRVVMGQMHKRILEKDLRKYRLFSCCGIGMSFLTFIIHCSF